MRAIDDDEYVAVMMTTILRSAEAMIIPRLCLPPLIARVILGEWGGGGRGPSFDRRKLVSIEDEAVTLASRSS